MARPKKGPAGPEDVAVRDRLLQAALTLFNTRGYAATTVREIVEQAGVSKPVLYYYFRNKEGIYLELVSEPIRRHRELLAAAGSGEGRPTERILALGESLLTGFREHLKVARLLFSIYYGPPQGAPPIDMDAAGRDLELTLHGLVREAIAAGEIDSDAPADVGWALNGIMNAAFQEQLCPQPRIDCAGLTRVLLLFLKGIGGKR